MHKISLYIFPVLFLAAISGVAQNNEATAFFIVRHAEEEKQDSTEVDPSLTEEGIFRARRLAYLLNSQPIEVVYTTRHSRNTATIHATAQLKGVLIKVYERNEEEELINTILKKHQGKSVLICGHADTVPSMLNVLTGTRAYQPIDPDDYDDIFIVTLLEAGNGKLIHLNY